MPKKKKHKRDKSKENKSKMNLHYDGKQQHWNKVELNFHESREGNDYKGGILVISISYDKNCN